MCENTSLFQTEKLCVYRMASEQEDTLVEHQMAWGSGQEVL